MYYLMPSMNYLMPSTRPTGIRTSTALIANAGLQFSLTGRRIPSNPDDRRTSAAPALFRSRRSR
jgi:hypothetical protein